ncbi:MoaD/ThiS family protein [Clavibacter michiganensis]|uniref:MoaD/ThiS family protein n=1 Tax=Clavibacter michiganensis subsp. insidiosus TaxID=33014 RepID=A0A0D5CJW4_9MICO|nr:MoaD/ThiS family protein [Clavibacter michiganensis]AJW79570.1 molybdopterin converting factor [Clavibacter michiganensis subsp. insidiosus]AWF97666.1 molybdopterin converting factor [Clavibacter michiganensis subsp. insidiosus]AWG02135.1 molybdopterin converting factor [Clavibacter michiganensis subsp. insidiosus]OQJ59390.1 molybdopterin synthase sulfur carrier subunit [Clavibacter michiganensis subsp. insidiosus]RII86232.1 MoaD/ThiS family protein [Clavibacter michiganensis subsp. insidio
MIVPVELFAAAAAALGRTTDEVDLPDPATLGDLMDALGSRAAATADPANASAVLARCTYLVEGVATTDRDAPLTAGSAVDVLPPFSGG